MGYFCSRDLHHKVLSAYNLDCLKILRPETQHYQQDHLWPIHIPMLPVHVDASQFYLGMNSELLSESGRNYLQAERIIEVIK